MPRTAFFLSVVMMMWWSTATNVLHAHTSSFALLPPANDNCANAMAITVSGGGFDYGVFPSQISDMSTATGEPGEFFEFATDYGHKKSVWFEFSVSSSRRVTIKLELAPGSSLSDPKQSGVTLYAPSSCLPSAATRLGSIISSGELEQTCTEPGTYRIQVTAVDFVTASFIVNLTTICTYDPAHPDISIYDCPVNAHEFNAGTPLPQNIEVYSGEHNIECHGIENPAEYNCLPVANKTEFLKSTWYVFTTGNRVDYLAFDFLIGTASAKVGYQILEGNVRQQLFSTLPLIECGMAAENFGFRYIELPCLLKPNTTYSLSLIFHKDFADNLLNVRVLQRGLSQTGWPRPVTPPVVASNQLGVLPASTSWQDRFSCNSFMIDNVCPPANPASGTVVINVNGENHTYDLATWATFSLATDANMQFVYSISHSAGEYYTRIFKRTLNASCPSPDPANDLYYEFAGDSGLVKCIPQGDYAIQVLAASNDNFPPATVHEDSWTNGYLGTPFQLDLTVDALPSLGLFRLDAPGNVDLINNLNPLAHGVDYPATPAVFVCENTVMPQAISCQNVDKAIYREFTIGDFDNDGKMDEGLICISPLSTRMNEDTFITYQLFKGDANQFAIAANAHQPGQFIPNLVDYPGYCIDGFIEEESPPGLDNFCACVTAGTYTLASYGHVDRVGDGDAPVFKLNTLKTIHGTRPEAELIVVGSNPGVYKSDPDYFSCIDNVDTFPPCGEMRKIIFREFYLPVDAVTRIIDVGGALVHMNLYKGRASDLSSKLEIVLECFTGHVFTDKCTPLEAGWYTVISYGVGPNFTNSLTWNQLGQGLDVGKSSIVSIEIELPITPNYNRPEKAYQAGVKDWIPPPVDNPNTPTRKLYSLPPETFCNPDTPFIPNQLIPCSPEYNRIVFYVFEITMPSFIQVRNLDDSFYTEIFPFNVTAQPGALLLTPPVYPCLATGNHTRQICDLPPGIYTLAVFATDAHRGRTISPALLVEEAGFSRFDHSWEAYDFDMVPGTNVFVDGKTGDSHPTLPDQAASRDVFYCTTGADLTDPTETQCLTEINPHIYAQPAGIPKPLFLQDNPPEPWQQPWRNLWCTFKLSGSGTCSLQVEALNGGNFAPFFAVYESDVDADIPWSTLQAYLSAGNDTIVPGLKLLNENVATDCDAETNMLIFSKNGCIQNNVRYYVVVSFDAFEINSFPPNVPNQAIDVSIKYDAKPTFGAPYDEIPTANVINGLIETAPPYTSVTIDPGDSFIGTDFSLLCYTANVTDPAGCASGTGRSAWFSFEVGTPGQLLLALEEIGVTDGWLANTESISVWFDPGTGNPVSNEFQLHAYDIGHDWLGACIDPGKYYILIRHCSSDIDTLQPYRLHVSMVDSPGDFCNNAISLNITDFNPTSTSAIVNCHTIGTDIGESLPVGNTCFSIPAHKTSWFHVNANAGPMLDLKFQLVENFTNTQVNLGDVNYRILAGSCGAMTAIACSEGNITLTLNCLGAGDYYVQVSMPEKFGANSTDVEGTITLTVTATPSDPVSCTEPFDPYKITADFIYTTDCETISFLNLSTAGSDITYLWTFPDGTSTEVNPVWTPPSSTTAYPVTLTVTNTVLNTTTTITLTVSASNPFFAYTPLPDQVICNDIPQTIDATFENATYVWDDNSTSPIRSISSGGIYWVDITIGNCTIRDSILAEAFDAQRTIVQTLCPGEQLEVHGEIFDEENPEGIVTLANADPSGCDSLLHVQLSYFEPAQHEFTKSICEGDSYPFDNLDLTATGMYVDTLVSSLGCDSLVTLFLNVTPKQISTHDIAACEGALIQLSPAIQGEGYAWNHGPVTDSIVVDAPGIFSVIVTDSANCVISEETFSVTYEIVQLAEMDTVICEGTTLLLPWGEVITPLSNDSFDYTWLYSFSGCDSLQLTVHVDILDAQSVSLPETITIDLGDSVRLEPDIDFSVDSITWRPPYALSCTTCINPWAKPFRTTDYLLTAWSVEGCALTAPVRIIVIRDLLIYIPNVFSPNADGINDIFSMIGKHGVSSVRRFRIYDRWGELLWEGTNFIPDGNTGWDGNFRGKPMPSGVFAWTCEIALIDGSIEGLSGSLTLLR